MTPARREAIAKLLCKHVLGVEWETLYRDRKDQSTHRLRHLMPPDETRAELISVVEDFMADLAKVPE